MANTPESTPVNPPDIKTTPTSVPVGPDGMTDYIRQPKAEIQSEAKNFLTKLRSDIDGLLHPQKVTSTPYAGEPVNAPNEVGVSADNDVHGLPDRFGGNTPPPGVKVPNVTSTPYAGAPVDAPNEVGVNSNTTISATANPGNAIEPNPSGNVTSPGTVPTVPGF